MFAFTPDDRPPRLMRYVERGTIPDRSLVCLYVHDMNLLIIDREKFSLLSDYDKRRVLRTHEPYHEITEFNLPQQAA